MRPGIFIFILLFRLCQPVQGALPDSAGKFIPDQAVKKLAQEFDSAYFPLFLQSLADLENQNYELIGEYFETPVETDTEKFIITEEREPNIEIAATFYNKDQKDKGYTPPYPVPWKNPPSRDPTWNLNFQSLNWLSIYLESKNRDSVMAAFKVIDDWIFSHTVFPNESERFAFNDHPCAIRLGILVKALNTNTIEELNNRRFENTLLLSVLSHLFLAVSLDNYASWHNHGIITDQSLIENLQNLPGFKLKEQFTDLAFKRIFEQLRYAFTDEGVHKEHSPCYHLFVNGIFTKILKAAKERKYVIPDDILKLKNKTDLYQKTVEEYAGNAKIGDCRVLNSTGNIDDGPTGKVFLYPRSGWIYLIDDIKQLKCIFQCDFFSYGHYHGDETSFILNVGGHDLIIDPGLYSYDENCPFNQYMRSARAHNLLLPDHMDFDPVLKSSGLSGITRYYQSSKKPGVIALEMTHAHFSARGIDTWRQMACTDNNLISVKDIAESSDTHTYSQLFHLAPDAKIIADDGKFQVTWPDHPYGLAFSSNADDYEIVEGQEDPVQGWYFPEFNKAMPAKVLILKKKGKGIIIKTDIRITNPETGTKSKRSEKQADELFMKLETIEREMLTHNPPPEKWRPARK